MGITEQEVVPNCSDSWTLWPRKICYYDNMFKRPNTYYISYHGWGRGHLAKWSWKIHFIHQMQNLRKQKWTSVRSNYNGMQTSQTLNAIFKTFQYLNHNLLPLPYSDTNFIIDFLKCSTQFLEPRFISLGVSKNQHSSVLSTYFYL